jgi:hypothetical protein
MGHGHRGERLMATFIVLTADQAAQVRGPVSPPYVLDPVEWCAGVFIVEASVLDHPAYASRVEILAPLPRQDLAQLLDLLPPAPPEE